MEAEQALAEIKRYEAEFAAILSRFKRGRDGIWIGEGDDPKLRQYVREIIDLFHELFGKNNYSQQISDEFNNGITNYTGSPSYKSVENIVSVVRAVLTRLNRNPGLLLHKVNSPDTANTGPINEVLELCHRFHEVARQLTHRREKRPTLEINDEYDAQDLLHALLRIRFDDIRAEEWTPSYGGGSSRMDFLLKEHSVVVEAKMSRKGLGAKEVSDQLIIDVSRYREHANCKILVCFVYDPPGLIKNARGVERDLERLSGNGLEVRCLIRP
ncbi:MAG TPA: hypothetical protein VFO86_01880 [Terriglobia bacterium]|nr:hypothetical protein [Terriglobia bacterium]